MPFCGRVSVILIEALQGVAVVSLESYTSFMIKTYNIVSKFVLYCIDGVVIAAQCTVIFSDPLCSPKFRY